MNHTTCAIADAAIAKYDAFVFSGVGRRFDGFHADSLAESAADACRVASRDRSLNKVTQNYYREHAVQFTAIYA